MLTVPEAARRAGRDPETVRRWIRGGRLPARKVGTQHVIEEEDLAAMLTESDEQLLPPEGRQLPGGRPMPNFVEDTRQRRGPVCPRARRGRERRGARRAVSGRLRAPGRRPARGPAADVVRGPLGA